MPGYRSLPSAMIGAVADSARSAEVLQRNGNPADAVVILEEALAASLVIRPELPGWLCGRLAALYRTLGRYDDEVHLLERYQASQTTDEARARYEARLSKARAIAMRKRPRQSGALDSVRQTLDRPRRTSQPIKVVESNTTEAVVLPSTDERLSCLRELFASSLETFDARLDGVLVDLCSGARAQQIPLEQLVAGVRAASDATIDPLAEAGSVNDRFSHALVRLVAVYFGEVNQ
jgi:hypothetical protein